MAVEQEGLKREIGLWGFSSNIINIVVGAGIFVLPAIVAAGLGSASILAYLFCGLLIMLVMLCFAEVGSKVTQSGGAYSYIEVAFGKYPGFLTANVFVFGAAIFSDAAVANAFADTLSYLFPVFSNEVFRALFFIFIFSGFTAINILGVKYGINLIKFVTIAKLIPLLIIVLAGWTGVSASNLIWEQTPSMQSLGEVSLILFFAFQGAETALNVGGEIRNPKKTIPAGIIISITVIVVLYLFIQIIAQGVLGNALADFTDAPLAEVATRILGPAGGTIILIGAAVSMFGFLSGEILNMPRLIYQASKDGVIIPSWLASVHPKFATPYIAIPAYAALGCGLSIWGDFEQLAILASASMLLIYFGVSLSVIKLRISEGKKMNDSFRIPGGYTIPIFVIIVILWFLSNLPIEELTGMAIFIAFWTIVFFVMKKLRQK